MLLEDHVARAALPRLPHAALTLATELEPPVPDQVSQLLAFENATGFGIRFVIGATPPTPWPAQPPSIGVVAVLLTR